ncbi:MAG: DUF4278 domain-containing protein [Elainellaceae cyanobacterium]
MRLTYRGLPYSYEPLTVDEAETQLRGRYRGHSYALMYPRHIPVPQAALDLQYRGIAYRTKTTGEVESRGPVSAMAPATASGRSNPSRKGRSAGRLTLMQEIGRVHRENLQRLLQHRLEVAKAQGNSSLVAQLETEMSQMA